MLSCFFLNVCIKQKKKCFSLWIEKLEDEEEEWFVDINYSPKITEKLWIVCLVAADKPLPEGRVKEHVGGVFTQKQEALQHAHPLGELLPRQKVLGVARVDGVVDLLKIHRIQSRQTHNQNRRHLLK